MFEFSILAITCSITWTEAEDIGAHVMSKEAMGRSKYRKAKLKRLLKWL